MSHIIRHETFDCVEHFGLNEQQAQVIPYIGHQCVINAGAGTGKTKTLTAAYIDALLNHTFTDGRPVEPGNIVAITFTKAAAEELRSRIVAGLNGIGRSDVAELMDDAWIMTINAFCTKVLKRERLFVARKLGIDANFSTLDESEARQMQEEIAQDIVARAYLEAMATDEVKNIETVFSGVSQGVLAKSIQQLANKARVYDIAPERVSATLSNERPIFDFERQAAVTNEQMAVMLCDFLTSYQQLKARQGVLDFTDQILLTRKLFEEQPSLAAEYKELFGVILIDEFQDTNFNQFDIFKLIATDNIIVVGDKRQSIYAFQGATVEVFDEVLGETAELPKQKPGVYGEVKLQRNYRSHSDILHTVNTLYGSPNLFGDDFVALRPRDEFAESHKPSPENGPRVKFFEILGKDASSSIQPRASEEIAREFLRLQNEEGYRPRDMVVLASTRKKLTDCAAVLKRYGFSAVVVGGNDLLNDTFVAELYAMLCAVDNPYDDEVLLSASISNYGRVTDEDLAEAAKVVRAHHEANPDGPELALWSAFKELAGKHPQSSLGLFVQLIQGAAQKYAVQPLSMIARYLFGASGIAHQLKNWEGDLEGYLADESFANVCAFFDLLTKWQKTGMTNRSCLLRCREAYNREEKIDFGTIPVSFDPEHAQRDTVRLMTIHQSKGLEFPVCAVIGSFASQESKTGKFVAQIKTDEQTQDRSLELTLNSYTLTTDEKKRATAQGKEMGFDLIDRGIKNMTFTPALARDLKTEKQAQESDEDVRKYYVAMTRAKERMIYVYAGKLAANPSGPLSAVARITQAINQLKNGEDSQLPAAFYSVDATMNTTEDEEEAEEQTQPSDEELQAQKAQAHEQLIASFTATTQQPAFEKCTYNVDEFAQWPAKSGSATEEYLGEVTASGIEQYHSCPRQFYYSGIMRVGLLSNTDSAMRRGTAMHTVLEQVANAVLVEKRCSADDMFTDALSEKIEHLYELDHSAAAHVIKAAKRVVSSPLWQELGACVSVKTEAQFYEPLNAANNDDFFLHGYIDICAQRDDGTWLALDYKSGTGAATHEKYETQARCYALALLREGALAVDITFVRPEVSAPQDEEMCETFEFHFEQCDCKKIEAFIADARAEMQRAGSVTDDELQKHVERTYCMRYCSYFGPLCSGVEK